MHSSAKASLRRLVLTLTIGSFSVAALMGVLALLGAGDLGDTELRILGTTVLLGGSSLVVLCYLATGGTPYAVFGALGGVADAIALVTALGLLWGDLDSTVAEQMARIFGVAVVGAVSLAQVCLLCALTTHRRSLQPLLWVTIVLAAVLAAAVSALVLGLDAGDATARFIGVIAILDVLGTVVTIALGVFGNHNASLTVTVSPDLAVRLRQEAGQTGRPVRELVDEAMTRYLDAIRG
jgi:hypothetical protein